jgi:hypothetical protein
MTHPTHGLDPNALEAALTDRERIAAMAAAYPDAVADLTWAEIDEVLAALSQNPGTSNTSGEAEPVAWRWRFPPGGWHYASEKPEFAPYDAERVHGPFPMYATLEPRASDREAVIDEIEAIIDAKVAEIDGQIPNSPRMRGRIGYAIERLSELRDAIRKLSEVSHEH